jgi:hypothetical protein
MTPVVLGGIAIGLVVIMLLAYFMLAEDGSNNNDFGDFEAEMPVAPLPVGVSWDGGQNPGGYSDPTMAGYPLQMALSSCKSAVADMASAIGFDYNNKKGMCYPKQTLNRPAKNPYSTVTTWRKL